MLHEEQGTEQSPNKSKVCTLLAVLPVHTAGILNMFFFFQYLTCWAHLFHWGCVKVAVTLIGSLGTSGSSDRWTPQTPSLRLPKELQAMGTGHSPMGTRQKRNS